MFFFLSSLLKSACLFTSLSFSLSVFGSFLQSVKGPFALWASGANRWAEEVLQCFLNAGITFLLLLQSFPRSSLSVSPSSHPLPLQGLHLLLQMSPVVMPRRLHATYRLNAGFCFLPPEHLILKRELSREVISDFFVAWFCPSKSVFSLLWRSFVNDPFLCYI